MGRLFNTYTDAIPVAFPSNTPLIIGNEIMILPLSIDETTTSGTASIIQKSLVFNVNVQVITFQRITRHESSIFQQQGKDSFSTKA